MPRPGQALHFQNFIRGGKIPRAGLVGKSLAGHQHGQLLVVHFAGGKIADLGPVPKDGDRFGNLHHFFKAVRDKHRGYALAFEIRHQRQQRVNLMPGEGRSRLIHDNQFGIRRHGAADGDQLSAGDGQVANLGMRVQRHADARHGSLRRFTNGPPVDRADRSKMMADGNIFSHRQIGKQRQVLIDDLDA